MRNDQAIPVVAPAIHRRSAVTGVLTLLVGALALVVVAHLTVQDFVAHLDAALGIACGVVFLLVGGLLVSAPGHAVRAVGLVARTFWARTPAAEPLVDEAEAARWDAVGLIAYPHLAGSFMGIGAAVVVVCALSYVGVAL